MFGTVRVALLIPAAGSGSRLGAAEPKALVDVVGAPLLRRTLERLAAAFSFVETVVLAPADALESFATVVDGAPAALGRCVVRAGGATRQESVRRGLHAIESDADLLCVHDAARPLIPAQTVREVLRRAAEFGAATAAVRPSDSVRIDDGEGTRVLERTRLWLVQTPQAFRRGLIERAHAVAEAAKVVATDDAALVEAQGHRIEVVETAGVNLKVTVATDLAAVREVIARELSAGRR